MTVCETEGRALKRATAKLFKSVGGLKVAAAQVEKSITVLGRYEETAGEAAGRFLNIADAREIEAIAPRPLVTEALCKLAGGLFVPHIDTTAAEGSAAWLVMRLSKELGEVSGEVAGALAGDGEIDGDEAAAAIDQLDDLDRVSAQLRAVLRARMAKAAGAVVRSLDQARDERA